MQSNNNDSIPTTDRHTVRIIDLFFLPPQTVGRLGGSQTPLDCYTWSEDPTIAGTAKTIIEPAITLDVAEDGSLQPFLPAHIRFRDGGLYRPVAPFLELWAGFTVDDQSNQRHEAPLTLGLLQRSGASSANLAFQVEAANLKAARRCGDSTSGFAAQLRVVGTDHERHSLLASSPNSPGSAPLVSVDRPIPLGYFQVIRPVEANEMGVDLSIVRVRYTPAGGEVYGPPTATEAPAPGTLRTHQIVKPENRILNPQAAWVQYDANQDKFQNPQPSDTYDGSDIDNEQSWGVVDDTCEVLIRADLVLAGLRWQAQARVAVGPPDFAPDRRPFISLADDLADRDPPVFSEDESLDEAEKRVNDLFQRAFETAGQLNLDAVRQRAIGDNGSGLPIPEVIGLPHTDSRSMTADDKPYADLTADVAPSVPHARLPLSDLIESAHAQLADLDSMVEKLREQEERIRMMIRPPYAHFRELEAVAANSPAVTHRDPRILRDQAHDMRMPPYMRDNEASALSLTHRQYEEVMRLVDRLSAARDAVQQSLAVATTDGLPPIHPDTPIRRRVAKFMQTQSQQSAENIRTQVPIDTATVRPKIFPRNLTARAEYRVAGNPESTRLESGVANCFPGLEFDHRNLDRRFLPGVVIEYVSTGANLRGGRFVEIDFRDPDLAPNPVASPQEIAALQQLRRDLSANADALSSGTWFISALIQGGKRIEMTTIDTDNVPPLDGLTVWRLVRSLEPDAVDVELTARTMADGVAIPPPVVLHGWRRRYTDPVTGVISSAFRPGELTQSLCSPWQHDFRDCGCTYWASNHPDIVHVENLPGDPVLSSGQSDDPVRALSRVRWLRSDRSTERSSEARETFGLNRPFEMDHYEINQRWQDLPVVLEGKEISSVYRPRRSDSAVPFASATEMADHITDLATLEHVLALEYLYAYYSVRLPGEVPNSSVAAFLRQDVVFIRHFILLVAVNEMQHLRWANQLLWELKEGGLIDPTKYGPSLGVSATVPLSARGGQRRSSLRPLTRETLADFIAIERPSGQIEGQYARVVATLRQKEKGYPDTLFQLASRIVNEGQDHFNRFREIESVMRQYRDTPWLRTIQKGVATDADVRKALDFYQEIVDNLKLAYATGSLTDRQHITAARIAMAKLDVASEDLAAQGIGVPFF